MSSKEALALLDKALKLHQAHMDGTAPTSVKSQTQLMDYMKQARRGFASLG